MNDLDLALVTIGGAGLLDDDDRTRFAPRDRSPLPTAAPRRPGVDASTPTAIPRRFDAVFAMHGQGLPVAFLRALAWNESGLDPNATTKRSSATGLLQVIDVVRTDHNRIHGTSYSRQELRDPVVNVTIAATAIRRIVDSYTRNHRDVPNLHEDWNNYRYAELVVFGWNAGWSERAGLGRVARYLTQLGITDITVELVHQHARAAGGSEYLQSADRLAWAQKVARHYAAERARDATTVPVASRPAGNDNAQPVTSPSQVDAPGPITSPSQVG